MWPFLVGESGSPLDLVQYGLLGVVLVAIITGWLWPKPAVEGLLKRVADLMTQLDRERADRREALEPAIRQLQDVTKSLADTVGRDREQLVKELRAILKEIQEILEREKRRSP